MLAPRASWHLHCLRFVVVTVAILCAFHTVGCGGNKEVPVDAGTPVNVAIAKFTHNRPYYMVTVLCAACEAEAEGAKGKE